MSETMGRPSGLPRPPAVVVALVCVAAVHGIVGLLAGAPIMLWMLLGMFMDASVAPLGILLLIAAGPVLCVGTCVTMTSGSMRAWGWAFCLIAITGVQTLLLFNANWMTSSTEAVWALPFFAAVETVLLFLPATMRWISPDRNASAAPANEEQGEDG